MPFRAWIHGLWSSGAPAEFKRPRTRGSAPEPLRRPVARLEVLEDRTLLSNFTVLNLNDSGPGSLRAVVATANAQEEPATITFAPGLQGTIKLTSGEIVLSKSMTINGPGSDDLRISASGASRIFEISGHEVTISGIGMSHE